MTTVKQSLSSSLVSLFGTVSIAADTTAKTIETTASGIDMLTSYVNKAKNEQRVRHKIEAQISLNNILEDAAESQSIRQRQLEERLAKDQRLAQLFQQNLNELSSLFTEASA